MCVCVGRGTSREDASVYFSGAVEGDRIKHSG